MVQTGKLWAAGLLVALVVLVGAMQGALSGSEAHAAPAYEDQNLQGMINGEPWEYVDGYVVEDTWADTVWAFYFYGAPPSEKKSPASPAAWQGEAHSRRASLFIQPMLKPGESRDGSVAVYWGNGNNDVAALRAWRAEILTIQTNDGGLITGRIAAESRRNPDANYINGNFSITFYEPEPLPPQ